MADPPDGPDLAAWRVLVTAAWTHRQRGNRPNAAVVNRWNALQQPERLEHARRLQRWILARRNHLLAYITIPVEYPDIGDYRAVRDYAEALLRHIDAARELWHATDDLRQLREQTNANRGRRRNWRGRDDYWDTVGYLQHFRFDAGEILRLSRHARYGLLAVRRLWEADRDRAADTARRLG